MFGKLEIFKMATGMATHAAERQSVIARNVANADTPGYRGQDIVSFADSYQSNTSNVDLRTTRPGHIGGSASDRPTRFFGSESPISPNGNSVSLEMEMVKASEVRQQYDMALAVYSSSLDILRASLGRR